MKYIIVLTITFTTIFANEDLLAYIGDINKINKTLQKVLQESQSNTSTNIKALYNPFYNQKKTKIKEKGQTKYKIIEKKSKLYKKELALSMILNQKAFINGKWYKVNDKFDDYVLSKINQDIVILKKNWKYTTLKLQKNSSILISTQGIK